jgi:ABC-type multidrug transport system fused ATPase/permease subunit
VRRLLAYTRPHLGALTAGTLLALLAGAAGLVQPLLAKSVIDALSAGRALAGPVALLALLVVVAALLSAANSYVLGRTAERVVLDVRRHLARRLVRLHADELDHTSPGDLISRTTADSSLLRSAATTSLVDLVDGGLRFVGALAFMGWLDSPVSASRSASSSRGSGPLSRRHRTPSPPCRRRSSVPSARRGR